MRPAIQHLLARFVCILINLAALASPLCAEDWPHWRGPHRNGTTQEPSGWEGRSGGETQQLWEDNFGAGSSSPIVVDDAVYIMGWRDGKDSLYCVQASTGHELWSVSYECPSYGRRAVGDQAFYRGPTATPEYDAGTGLLYTLSCDGDLKCWDTTRRGYAVWSVNLYDQYDVPRRPRIGRSGRRDYGYTTSPLVHGDWIIVEVGADVGTLVAFHKKTGQQVWLSQASGPAGHSGGLVPIRAEGVPCVAVLTLSGLLVTRLDDERAGRTVAEFPWETDFGNNIATPAVLENYVLLTSGYNQNSICKLEVTLRGAKELWRQPYASKVCSPVIHQGRVYWGWQQVHCLDFETGDQLWAGGRFGDAGSCTVTGDNRLIMWGGQGSLALIESAARSPTAYLELSRTDPLFADDVWPHIVLAQGRFYCKDKHGTVKCLTIKSSVSES